MGGALRWMIAMSVAISVMLGAVLGDGDWASSLADTLIALAYSLLIGLPGLVLFRSVGRRWRGGDLQRWLVYVGVLVALTLVATLVVRTTLVLLGLMARDELWSGMAISLEISAAIALPMTLGAFSFARLATQLHRAEGDKQRALALAAEARFASLESRIRPHFLFNALNSAASLIPEQPARAEEVLVRLGALLRSSLDVSARAVPLDDELRLVVDYLEIERTRFGDRLAYQLELDDAVGQVPIPAFAIQTLVENSVKHALAARPGRLAIVIRARRVADRIVIDVTDDGPGFAGPAWLPGHGLHSLRLRLDALFGAAAAVTANTAAGGTGAHVSIAVPGEVPA